VAVEVVIRPLSGEPRALMRESERDSLQGDYPALRKKSALWKSPSCLLKIIVVSENNISMGRVQKGPQGLNASPVEGEILRREINLYLVCQIPRVDDGSGIQKQKKLLQGAVEACRGI